MVVAQVTGESLQEAFWPLVFLLVGLLATQLGYRRLRPELRRLRSEPVDVHEAAGAYHPVELRGTVEPADETLESPFTGTECVAHRWRVLEYEADGGWSERASGEAIVPFRLADDTGSVRVEPDESDVEFRQTSRVEVDAGESSVNVLGNVGESPVGGVPGLQQPDLLRLDPDVRRRYTEERLDVGEEIAVYGTVDRDPGASGDWGSGALDATVRRREPDDPLLVTEGSAVPPVRRGGFLAAVVLAVGVILTVSGALALATAVFA